jgi:hypothetical protein
MTTYSIPDFSRVEVYWNLHRDCFSVRACSGPQRGRVVAHVSSFTVKNVDLVVQQAGRLKVLRTGRKNVHAFVRGEWVDSVQTDHSSDLTVTYNPYKFSTFVTSDGHRPVLRVEVLTGAVVDSRPTLRPHF